MLTKLCFEDKILPKSYSPGVNFSSPMASVRCNTSQSILPRNIFAEACKSLLFYKEPLAYLDLALLLKLLLTSMLMSA